MFSSADILKHNRVKDGKDKDELIKTERKYFVNDRHKDKDGRMKKVVKMLTFSVGVCCISLLLLLLLLLMECGHLIVITLAILLSLNRTEKKLPSISHPSFPL